MPRFAFFPFSTPSPRKILLCDSWYVNKPGCITSFQYRRYHPHEFSDQGPIDSEEFFNQVHSGLRSVIERTFKVWKNKLHIVDKGYSLVGFEVRKQLAIIESTAALHNFVRRCMSEAYLEPNEDPEDEEEEDDDDDDDDDDDNDIIDLNRTPPPEALRHERRTMDRESIYRAIFQYMY